MNLYNFTTMVFKFSVRAVIEFPSYQVTYWYGRKSPVMRWGALNGNLPCWMIVR